MVLDRESAINFNLTTMTTPHKLVGHGSLFSVLDLERPIKQPIIQQAPYYYNHPISFEFLMPSIQYML